MGKSLPPQAEVDLVHSFARRVGDTVEIVLARPQVDVAADAEIVLRQRGVRLVSTAELSGTDEAARVVVRFPGADLSDGTWQVRYRSAEETTSLGCRLLVQGRRPVVLLWGTAGSPSMIPRPHPRTEEPPPADGSPVRDVVAGARRVIGSLTRRARRSV